MHVGQGKGRIELVILEHCIGERFRVRRDDRRRGGVAVGVEIEAVLTIFFPAKTRRNAPSLVPGEVDLTEVGVGHGARQVALVVGPGPRKDKVVCAVVNVLRGEHLPQGTPQSLQIRDGQRAQVELGLLVDPVLAPMVIAAGDLEEGAIEVEGGLQLPTVVVNVVIQLREAIVGGLRRLHHLRIHQLERVVGRPLLRNSDFARNGRLRLRIGDEPAELEILRHHVEQRRRQHAAKAVPQLASGRDAEAMRPLILGDQHVPLFETQSHLAEAVPRAPPAVFVEEGPLVGVIFRVSQVNRRGRHLVLFEIAKAHGGVTGHVHLLRCLHALVRFFLREDEIPTRPRGFAPLVRIAPGRQAADLKIVGDKETVPKVAPDIAVKGRVLFKHGNVPLEIGRELPIDGLGIRQGGIRLRRPPKATQDVLDVDIALILIQGLLQPRGKGPVSVVLALVVFSAPGVGEDFIIVRIVYCAAELEPSHKAIGDALGANIDGSAPEGGLPIGAVGLLHRERIHDKAREKIERHHVPGEIYGRNGSPIDGGLAVAFPKTPYVNKLPVYQGKARHALERHGHVRISHPADGLGTQEIGHRIVNDALVR